MTRTTAALLAAWLALSLFLASLAGFHFVSSTPDNFYGMQTEAFLDGHLALRMKPNPVLASLPNPYEGDQNLPYRVQDLSYYKGRYYSYFGAAPIVVLLLPWKVLTGTFLRDQAATVILECATNLAALLFLLRLRRYFPNLGTASLVCGYLLVTVGSWQPLHIPPHNAGTVAQTSAYLWFTLGLLCLEAGLRTGKNRWICALSACIGMMIASRPSFLPCIVLLFPFALRAQHRTLRALAAAAIPIGLIMALLLAYNFERFDSPLEFGVRLQLVDHDHRHVSLLTSQSLSEHWLTFLTKAPKPLPQFPFLETGDDDPIGLIWACPAILFLALGAIGLTHETARKTRDLFLAVTLSALGLFGFLAAFWLYLFHYSVDFFMAFAWAAALGWFVSQSTAVTQRSRKSLAAAGWLLVVPGATLSLLFATHESGRFDWLARLANSAAYRIERLAGTYYGPVRLKLEISGGQLGKNYPLLSASRRDMDTCYLRLLPGGQAKVGILQNALGPLSPPFPFDPSRPHELDVRMGSLLPPPPHPIYEGWTDPEVQQATRLLEVVVDGKSVLRMHGESLGSVSGKVSVGVDSTHRNRIEARFPGRITLERLPFVKSEWDGSAFPEAEGPAVAFTFQLDPAFPMTQNEPLLSTGLGEGATTVYLRTPDPGHAVFGIDSQGYGGTESEPVAIDRSAPHSALVIAPAINRPGPLLVVDGTTVAIGSKPASVAQPKSTFYGANAARSSVVQPSFSGSIWGIHVIADPGSLLVSPRSGTTPDRLGEVSFDSKLDSSVQGGGQPLLVCGETGRADLVFVRVTGPSSVIVGHDHWGVGAHQSAAIAADTRAVMHWRIQVGDLRKSGEPSNRCRVWLNDRLVLDSPFAPYPVSLGSVRVGANLAGGSSCEAQFHGRIIGVKSTP